MIGRLDCNSFLSRISDRRTAKRATISHGELALLAMLNYVVDPQVITPLVPAKLTSISKTALRDACSEYRVEHRRWKISSATDVEFNVDVATLYGEQFAEA